MVSDSLYAVPTLHLTMLAASGWLLMVACFFGWHMERPRRRGQVVKTANDVVFLHESTAETKRKAA